MCKDGKLFIIIVIRMPYFYLQMMKGVHVYLINGPLWWFQISIDKFWWHILDFLDGVALGDPSGAVVIFEQSMPEFEIWQPGLSVS